jgi:hypothetical protein
MLHGLSSTSTLALEMIPRSNALIWVYSDKDKALRRPGVEVARS